jgi:hypothetical protein
MERKNTPLEQLTRPRQQAESILKQQSIHTQSSDNINPLSERNLEIRYDGLLENTH